MTVALALAQLAAPAAGPRAGTDPGTHPGTDPAPRPALRVVPAPAAAPPFDDEPGGVVLPLLLPGTGAPELLEPAVTWDETWWDVEDRTPARALPAPEPVAHALVQGLVEVLSGARPLRLFRSVLEVELYAAFASRLAAGNRRPGPRPQRVVHSLHAQTRSDGVAEVCATVRRGDRYVAVALRLEGFGGRWLCTDLEGL